MALGLPYKFRNYPRGTTNPLAGWAGLIASAVVDHGPLDSGVQDEAPSRDELRGTLEELQAYRSRLHDDVVAMGQKLKLPARQVAQHLSEHPELNRLDLVIQQVERQLAAL